jgi:hypothetical protein
MVIDTPKGIDFKQSFSTTESLDSPRETINKYKTELCRKWIENNNCPYEEKCRFAHGKVELQKYVPCKYYKLKDCKSFHSHGFCNYGPRCMFRHHETKLEKIERTYYKLILETRIFTSRRLNVFQKVYSANQISMNHMNDQILMRFF